MISIRNLAKRYGGNEVLRGISFDVERGEIVGIIGPSGSGKSTLLRCINFLEEYESAEIRFEGKTGRLSRRCRFEPHQRQHRLNGLRTQIGMVFQDFNLFPHMTVLGNVLEARRS